MVQLSVKYTKEELIILLTLYLRYHVDYETIFNGFVAYETAGQR